MMAMDLKARSTPMKALDLNDIEHVNIAFFDKKKARDLYSKPYQWLKDIVIIRVPVNNSFLLINKKKIIQ